MATITATNGVVNTQEEVAEGTPYSVDIAFKDENKAAYTPDSTITMRVYSPASATPIETGTPITAAETIEVTTAAATNDITAGELRRYILLEWTAITTRFASPGVPQRCEIHYPIKDLKSVTGS